MNVLTLALATLAVYRVSYLLTRETGPFRLGERWRNLYTGENWIGEGLRCLYCISFWLCLPLGLWFGGMVDGWLYWLGIAGAIVLLDQWVT